jgi:hypothetical protein
MKQIFFYSFLAIVIFSSCKKCLVEPVAFEWPSGTSDYAPYTIGSTFTYELTGAGPATDSFTLTVTKDSLINGLKFYKLESNKPALSPDYFVNYNNGDITEITYNLNYLGLGIISVPKVTETTLKSNNAINDTWIENLIVNYPVAGVPGGVDLSVIFTHTMLQKNYAKTVLNKNFTNTIAIKEVISTIIPSWFAWPPEVPTTSQFDNFYAQGAGLVQRDISNGTSQKLKRFNIVK